MGDEQECFVPMCEESLKPHKGQRFITLEEGIEFYKRYGRIGGFDVRLSSAKKTGDTIIWRYVVCSREGEKHSIVDDVVDGVLVNRRRRVSMRCGCMARVIFKFDALFGYVVNVFNEEHNHPLVEEQYKHFMKLNRNLDSMHQKFILDCTRANIGPTQSYKLLSELLGGHDGVGCSLVDVRNFSRDMKAFVEGADAQMLLNEMCMCQAFNFEYVVDEEDRLKRLFWCDPVSRRNYHMFGDVVAFDTTYSTNKYCMIFAPFTGKNNHGRPITFVAGLLSKEDSQSFSWLFNKFVACMGAAPKLMITDQDLGMRVAIMQVFPYTRHRWCMWHIMLKLADKVSKELHANEDFKKDLNYYVWSEVIEPEVFEEGWGEIMKKNGLRGEAWFKTMFKARKFWVPAFFRDFPLSGLLRTTSISKCENSFYKRYTRSRSNLLEFLMNFNYALDAQRHLNAQLNYIDKSAIPYLDTHLPFEKHAATIYTSNMFRTFQEEVSGTCFRCIFVQMSVMMDIELFQVQDEFDDLLNVQYNKSEETFVYDYKMFGRMDILCRHILFVFKNKRLRVIPEKYIVGRWMKQHLTAPVHDVGSVEVEKYAFIHEDQIIMNKLTMSFYGWMRIIEGKSEKMAAFSSGLNELGDSIIGEQETFSALEKKKNFEDFYGAPVPENIEVLPPNVVKTKGSGSRLVSRKEKEIKNMSKPLTRCVARKEMANHDSRNCNKVGKNAKKRKNVVICYLFGRTIQFNKHMNL